MFSNFCRGLAWVTNITNMFTCFYVLPFRLQARSCLSSLLAALPLTMRLYRPCRTALDSPAIPATNCRDHLQIAHGDKERVEPCQILKNDSKLGASLMGHGSSGWPELSESAFPIPPAWQFDAACGLEIQGSDPCIHQWRLPGIPPSLSTTSALAGSLSL